MGKKRKNPFRAGMGEVPPHRAGHEAAVRELARRLDRLFDERPGSGVILYGPRGTGKTALLTELHGMAKERNVRPIELNTGDMTGDPKTLGKLLRPPRWFDWLSIGKLTAMFPWGGGAGVEFGNPVTNSAERALRLLLKGPVLLIVDEAHTIPPGFAMVLLQVSQRCIRDGLPLLLVLAGTPGIRASLRRADASFWERARRLKIGRLETRDATREALSVPAKESGMSFAEDALEFLVEESQGYPYFIQLVGEQSWDATVARDPDATHIGLETAQVGVLAANKQRDELYADRLQEITDRGMKSEALAVSKAFAAPDAGDALSRTTLGAVLKPALTGGRTVDNAIKELFAVGLIWQAEDDHSLWEPGIPSLCTYITKYVVFD